VSLKILHFKLDRHENVTLESMTSNLKKINKPGELIEIDSFALSSLFDNDLQNYLMYWSACEVIRENTVLWMISSKEISINEAQVRIIFILKCYFEFYNKSTSLYNRYLLLLLIDYCHKHKIINIIKINKKL